MSDRGRILSGNALKLMAALAMLVDHIGVILLPQFLILRVIGRLAFPIFAFMIAEGCRYTRHKWRYLGTMLGVGIVCQSALFVYNRSLEMSVLITFSLSIVLIFSFQWLKEEIFAPQARVRVALARAFLFGVLLCGVGVLGFFVDLDYGVEGTLLPLFAAALHPPKNTANTRLHALDDNRIHALVMALGMLLLALNNGALQFYSFFALLPLFLYSGKRGKWHLKYFFYVFYPAHLLLLQMIAWIVF